MTLPRGFGWRLAASAAVLAVLWSFTPPSEPRIRLCGFYWLTGRPCPLCGLTRAVFALAKGQWAEAFHFHALSPLGLTMLLSLFWETPLRARLWTTGLAAFACYGVVRLLA
ncbi:MAG: DUF2752 domain-containing protein [Bryobacteraceae bacterium]